MNRGSGFIATGRIVVSVAGCVATLFVAAACATPAPGGVAATAAPPVISTPPATGAAPASSAPAPLVPSTKSTPAIDPAVIFAADGIGPYVLGATLIGLQGKGLVADVFNSPICPGVKIGKSTGTYAGKLRLAFATDGKLWYIDTKATDLQTPSGGRIGMTIVELKALYGSKGTVIPASAGQIGGLLVKVEGTPRAIVFLQDNVGKAFSMSAGPADVVESFATGGEGC